MTLFDPDRGVDPPPKLSADRRRTFRNQASIERGIHPVTKVPLRAEGNETCGTCVHVVGRSMGKTYWKCRLNETGGAATDVRLSWPACQRWGPQAGLE